MKRSTSVVNIRVGEETRNFQAFITTAPIAFDRPSTLTLYESSFAEIASYTAESIPFDRAFGCTEARLVLIDSTELDLQQAQYREGRYLIAAPDPVLVGRNTLEDSLWHHLGLPSRREVHG
jgi:hypothetical protein